MRERRRRGAFCLVAALGESARAAAAAAAAADRGAARGREGDEPDGEGGGDVDVDVVKTVEVPHDHVLGTLECSRHEFDGTPLEVQVEEGGAKVARWGGCMQTGQRLLSLAPLVPSLLVLSCCK